MVSSVLAQAILGQQAPDILGQFDRGREEQRAQESRELSSQLVQKQFQGGQIGELATKDPKLALQMAQLLGIPVGDEARLDAFAKDTQTAFGMAQAENIPGAIEFIRNRRDARRAQGVSTTNMDEWITQAEQDPAGAIDNLGTIHAGFVQSGRIKPLKVGDSAGEREFKSLTAGLTTEEKESARRIKLGLAPRAVGSSAQTIADLGTSELVGDSQAIINERKKFGELSGSSRAKAIDKGFERIGKISLNIRNLDRAIKAVEDGAGTGVISKRFPSIKAAAVELDQIQGVLALDVIGAVTFGALSEGELRLAKEIALPTGLDGPELIQHLRDRQAAQSKLRDYYQEQIDFLDRGGSVAGFLREKGRADEGSSQQPEQTPAPATAVAQPAQGQDLSKLSTQQLQELLQSLPQ